MKHLRMSNTGGAQRALLMTHFKAMTRKLSIYSLRLRLSRNSVIVICHQVYTLNLKPYEVLLIVLIDSILNPENLVH